MDNLLILKIRRHLYVCTKRAKNRFGLKKKCNHLISKEKKIQGFKHAASNARFRIFTALIYYYLGSATRCIAAIFCSIQREHRKLVRR